MTKPAKEFTDSQGRRRIKGNMDIELAVDMMEMVDRLDHVVLFSGDGDFRSLIEAVQRKGVRATVVSTIRSSPPMIADELRRQADQFIDLDQLASDIERVHADRPPRRDRAGPPPSDNSSEDEEEFEDEMPAVVTRRTPRRPGGYDGV